MKTKNVRTNQIFSISIAVLSVILLLIPTGFENPEVTESTIREKAEIIKTEDSDLQHHGIILVGTQTVQMKILSGEFEGDTVTSQNILLGQMGIDKYYKVGDKVLAIIKPNKEGTQIQSARADDIYRVNLMYILFGLFALCLIALAGWTGFKALLSFVFTGLAIWKIMLPLTLKGFPSIPLSLSIVAFVTTVIIVLISGFTRKGAVALSGAILGVILTTVMALFFGALFRIPGTVQEFSETLLYAGFSNLNLSDIFISCIFIAAAGAVMDVAMDIAASQNEIVEQKPDILRLELIRSGFRIASPVIGTMTTTLLFAYSGSFMFTFMVFMAKGTPAIQIFNTNFIAAEVLHTLVGSFGLVMVAPVTAVIGGYVYVR